MNQDDINERVENYLKGRLSPEDSKRFEEQINTNAELATEVDLIRMEHEVMNQLVKEDLFKQMAQWDAEEALPSKNGKFGIS